MNRLIHYPIKIPDNKHGPTGEICSSEFRVLSSEVGGQRSEVIPPEVGTRRHVCRVQGTPYRRRSSTFDVRSLMFGSAPEERHVYRTESPPQPSMLFMRQNAERRGRTEKARLPARQSFSGGNDVVGQVQSSEFGVPGSTFGVPGLTFGVRRWLRLRSATCLKVRGLTCEFFAATSEGSVQRLCETSASFAVKKSFNAMSAKKSLSTRRRIELVNHCNPLGIKHNTDLFLCTQGSSWAEKGVKLKNARINKINKLQFDDFQKGSSWAEKGVKLLPKRTLAILKVLIICLVPVKIEEIKQNLIFGSRDKLRELYLNPLRKEGMIEITVRDKPNSPEQRYVVTEKGRLFLGGFEII
jgi:hypothetical protein